MAGSIVVVSPAFSPAVRPWLAFGVVVMLGLAQLDRTRGGLRRILDGSVVLIAVLLIGFAPAATETAVAWLSFGLALGLVGIAFAGLSLNEVANWRAQHRLAELRWVHPEAVSTVRGPQAA